MFLYVKHMNSGSARLVRRRPPPAGPASSSKSSKLLVSSSPVSEGMLGAVAAARRSQSRPSKKGCALSSAAPPRVPSLARQTARMLICEATTYLWRK